MPHAHRVANLFVCFGARGALKVDVCEGAVGEVEAGAKAPFKPRAAQVREGRVAARAARCRRLDLALEVKITLPPIDKSDVARLVDRLAESPLIVARLAARELSPEIADIAESLGIRIFPTSWKDLEMSCTCPDWAVPCKHIAAAIYKLSEEIDANPFLLFTLRGIDLIAEMESRGVELEVCW